MRLGCVLLVMAAVITPIIFADEEWSWGPESKEASTSSPIDTSASKLHISANKSSGEDQQEDREARFIGFGQKLCVLGIGHNCGQKPYPPAIDSHYGPPPAASVPSTSSYATLSYDNLDGPAVYPAASSSVKGSTGGLKPFFVAPKPFPSKTTPEFASTFPNLEYTPPKAHPTHVAPAPTPTGSHSQVNPSTFVQHIHTHTHIHQGINGVIPPVPTVDLPVGTVGLTSGTGFQPVLKPTFGIPIQTPVQVPGPIIEVETPAYLEECQCVPASVCSFDDIVSRSSPVDISGLIDARSRGSDILSNATEILSNATEILSDATEIHLNATDIESETKPVPENYTSTESTARLRKVQALSDSQEESRQKRDLLTSAHHYEDKQTTDFQERQFTAYVPGVTGCGNAHVCCRKPLQKSPRQQYACGKSNAAGVLGRVKNPYFVNGDAEFAEYPWQAALLKLDQGDSVYVCGATLISDRHLLTAAHCIKSLQPSSLIVRLGEWDVSTTSEFYQYVEVRVVAAHIHPDYYAGNLQNDIALITLQNNIDFTHNPHISPVCLPENYGNFIGQRCHSTGWGKDAFGAGGKFQRVLKEVELPIVSHLQCQTALRHTHLGASFNLHEGNICAGGEKGRDTCKGDGGGPLVCPGPNGNAQLVGLVSWGIDCGKAGIPGVYVNVAHYLDWIQATIYQ